MARCSIVFFVALVVTVFGKRELIDAGAKLETSKFPKSFEDSETIKEFGRLVEKHNLNVSVIISRTKNYEEGNVKEIDTMTMTLPVNEETITKGTLNKECYDKLAEIAHKEKLTIAASRAVDNDMKIYTNNKKGVPINKAYKMFTGIKKGKTGFVFDARNYVAQYTFLVNGADGKNETTKILHGDVDIDTVAKSDSITEDKEKIIKKALVDALFMYEEDLMPKALTTILEKELPDATWDAATEVGENSFIDSDCWIQMKFMGDNYLVYAEKK